MFFHLVSHPMPLIKDTSALCIGQTVHAVRLFPLSLRFQHGSSQQIGWPTPLISIWRTGGRQPVKATLARVKRISRKVPARAGMRRRRLRQEQATLSPSIHRPAIKGMLISQTTLHLNSEEAPHRHNRGLPSANVRNPFLVENSRIVRT